MRLNVVLGQDLSAYAHAEIEVPDGASEAEVLDRIRAFTGSAEFEDLVFDEDWGTADSLRVVTVENGSGTLLEEVALEPSPYDGGQWFRNWLNGRTTLNAAIRGAAKAALIDQDEPVVVCRGTLTLPGAEAIEVEFKCRKGATREERGLAFLEALAQIGTVDYVVQEEVQHDGV